MVRQKCEKTVLIKTTRHEKSRLIVVLSCLEDGSKLPPLIIFKRKNLLKSVKFPDSVNVWAHPKAWIDEDTVKDCPETVWN